MIAFDCKISDLHFDPANARKHSEKNLSAIKGSLAKFGQQKPIVVDKNNVVIAGNGTLQAAKSLGWDSISAVKTELEGAEAIAFALADNRTAELAEWDIDPLNKTLQSLKDIDFDLGAIGFDDDFMSAHTPEVIKEGLTDPDAVPEQVETRCKPGDLWTLGNHRLLCGDSTNIQHVERLMGGEKADMVFTDPPYGVNLKYNSHQDKNLDDYYDLMNGWMHIAKSVSPFIVATVGHKNNNWWFKNHEPDSFLIWFDKTKQSPGSHAYLIKCELVLLWGKVPGDKRYSWDFLDITHDRSKDGSEDHPCPKPIKLIEELLRPNCKNILDLFLGSGSTLIACEKTGRKCYGMEIDPHYCDVILKRWEDFTGNKAVLESQLSMDNSNDGKP